MHFPVGKFRPDFAPICCAPQKCAPSHRAAKASADLVLAPADDLTIDYVYYLQREPDSFWEGIGLKFEQVQDAIATLFANNGRVIRVVGHSGPDNNDLIEIVIPEAASEGGDDALWPKHPLAIDHLVAAHRGGRLLRADLAFREAVDTIDEQHAALLRRSGGCEPHHASHRPRR